MGVKTIAPIKRGQARYFQIRLGSDEARLRERVLHICVYSRHQEIMVDYGGKYFERDSSSDSEMGSDDEDFMPKSKRRKHGARAPARASRR